ncbi:glutathione S-transferase T3-like [Brassica napus]|uniref:glutathione S-transferase T3-like n=1 Tax=Brassica napus TaxID=3708 RepID=UPI002078F388|nr:glutathione S-transferase T3-like [Brassica napus]
MYSNQYSHISKFIDLLNRQQETVFGFSQDSVKLSSSQLPGFGFQATEASNFQAPEETHAEHRERRKWTPINDVVLISSWLNTSKDPVVGNEKRCGTFWKRIDAYFVASLKIAGSEHREATHCKQRWQKINDLVNKFCGAYEAAKLRNDQKWCELSSSKTHGPAAKKRKCDEGAQSSSSYANETTTAENDQGSNQPPDVKVAKGRGKKTMAEGKAVSEFQRMWSIKKEDLAIKERLTKIKLLDSLIAKAEPLAEYEEAHR